MRRMNPLFGRTVAAAAAIVGFLFIASAAEAHCDTMDGPVVAAAKLALEKGDVTPVLRWIKPEAEREVREIFAKVLAARAGGGEARAVADRYFFESLVRIHRAGEGAPYEGLLPSGTPIEPAISLADSAIASGDVGELSRSLGRSVAEGIRERFARVVETKKHADESVAAGREFVEAYVEFTHYVERLHADASGSAGHHTEGAPAENHGRKP
jgi:hypothetical protein